MAMDVLIPSLENLENLISEFNALGNEKETFSPKLSIFDTKINA